MPGHLKTLTFLLFAVLPVVADQSAIFSSRATQGLAWTGLSQVIREKITVTVQPDHLDVEHELEIDARSNWSAPNNPNSLEITGQLTLEKGTVVTGLLLWNGNVILKGKLRTREMARQQYEEVVDRNVTNPPPPRDPALLEKVGENRYDLSIFPVALNGSRKLRLRYLIPTRFEEGTHRSRFPHAFSRLASVTLRGGSGIQGYALTSVRQDGSLITVKNEEDITSPLTLDPDAYKQFQPYNYWLAGTGAALRFVTPLFGEAYGSRVFLGSIEGVNGHAAHYIFRPPQDITGIAQETTNRVVAMVKTQSDSVAKEVALNDMASSGLEELRIFSGSTFKDSITWRIYAGDSVTKEVIEKPRAIVLSDGQQFLRTFGHTPFYPMTKTMPASLAAAWGFIDAKYALLALEQDTLPTALAKEYVAAGVPGLNASDIYPEVGALDSIPLSAWLLQRNISREELLGPTSVIAALGLPAGIRWLFRDGALVVEIDPEMRKRDLRITLHGLDGRLLKQWNGADVGGGNLNWFPKTNGYGFGTCMLRITSGNQTWSARVTLR